MMVTYTNMILIGRGNGQARVDYIMR